MFLTAKLPCPAFYHSRGYTLRTWPGYSSHSILLYACDADQPGRCKRVLAYKPQNTQCSVTRGLFGFASPRPLLRSTSAEYQQVTIFSSYNQWRFNGEWGIAPRIWACTQSPPAYHVHGL